MDFDFDCFISYAAEDREIAAELYRRLKAEGLEVWFDQDRKKCLPPGCDWQQELKMARSRCCVLLALCSRRFCQSHWTLYETFGAQTVIPITVEGQPKEVVPEPLLHFQGVTLDVLNPNQADWLCLVAAIRGQKEDWPDVARRPRNLPYKSLGKLFKGRIAFMEKLRQRLISQFDQNTPIRGAKVTQPQTICGLGGVGKTRLAVEYAWAHAQEYSAILFVTADSRESLQRNLAALTGPLVLDLRDVQDTSSQEAKIRAAIQWLIKHPVWFLILDNVDTEEAASAVEALLPQLYGGHVVITSRLNEWSSGVEPLELDVLDSEDAKAFLLERTNHRRRKASSDDTDARLLCDELDGLALALEQAGAFIEHQRCSLADYLGLWRAGEQRVRRWFHPRVSQYPRSLTATWETTMQRSGPAGRTLLRLCSRLAADPIPEGLIQGDRARSIFSEAMQIDRPQGSAEAPEDALAEIAAYSMVKRIVHKGVPSIILHRVVREITREAADREGHEQAWTSIALQWLHQLLPAGADDARTWKKWGPAHSHVAEVVRCADALGICEPTARLMTDLGDFLRSRGSPDAAVAFVERAVAIREREFGLESPATLTSRTSLEELEGQLGHTDRSEQLCQETLGIKTRVLGWNHASTLISRNNFACLQRLKGKHAKAAALFRSILADKELALGADHRSTFTGIHNLAGVLCQMGDWAEAEALFRRAVEGCRRTLGPEHPDTLGSTSLLASMLLEQGRKEEASQLYQQACDGYETTFGPDATCTLDCIRTLAILLFEKKAYAAAKTLYERILASLDRVHGPDGPETVLALSTVVGLLNLDGRDTEGVQLLLARSQRYNGLKHPKTISLMNDLARHYELRKEWDLAEAQYCRAMEHSPADIIVLGNYAFMLVHARSNLSKARELYCKALEIDPKDGVNHVNYAGLLLVSGDLIGAREHVETGWSLIAAKTDRFAARALLFRATVAALERSDTSLFMGQLKTLLTQGFERSPSAPASLLAVFKEQLSAPEAVLFESLYQAIHEEKAVSRLDELPGWEKQAPEPPETPWPQRV